ncbi:MAG: phospholipase [Erysipelothrix sp.]|nr:phospholipase [Erysipelothrix sp.]
MYHVYKNNNSDHTLVLFHGTGGDENSLLSLAQEIAPHMNHLALRGEVVSFGQRRFSKINHENEIIDLNDMLARVPGIQRIIEILDKRYHMGTLWALGFSNGANALTSILLAGKPMFEKALLFRPMDLDIESTTDLNQMEIRINSGQRDDILPDSWAFKLEERLIKHNANVTHKSLNVDHWMRNFEVEELKDWFEQRK